MNDPSEIPGAAAQPEPAPPEPEAALPPEPPKAPESPAPSVSPDPATSGQRPTYVFFGVLAAISLIADVTTKAWAEIELSRRIFSPSIVVIPNHLSFTLAYNRGGAWGLLQNASESLRKPFFLLVSALAIAFIVSLYARLAPNQRALKWGLPLVLGGALGNLSDRITRSQVIDFIDYRADWILGMNRAIAKVAPSWGVTDHWPTFNVADIAICIGVGLMAVDMITSRRSSAPPENPAPVAVPPTDGAAAAPAPEGPVEGAEPRREPEMPPSPSR